MRTKKDLSMHLNRRRDNERKDTRKKLKHFPEPEVRTYIGKGIAYSINPKSENAKVNKQTPGPGNRNPIHLFKLINVKLGKFGKASRDNGESIYAGAFSNNKEVKA